MAKKGPYLKPEEWAFAVKKKEWLPKEIRHCWIPDEQTAVASKYEFDRQILIEGQKIINREPREPSQRVIDTPYVELTPTQRGELEEDFKRIPLGAYGSYGQSPIVDLDAFRGSLPNTFRLHINWDFPNPTIISAFKMFLQNKRGEKKPIYPDGRGAKRSGRPNLNKLAAYRLLEKFRSSRKALKFAYQEVDGRYPEKEKLIYETEGSFDDAVSKLKKDIEWACLFYYPDDEECDEDDTNYIWKY